MSDDRDMIEALMNDYCDTLILGDAPFDIAQVERLYIRDARFTAYDIAPPNAGYIGWAAYEQGWAEIMSRYASFEMRWCGAIDGGRRGDMIWSLAPFEVFVRATPEMEPLRKEGRVSLVWLREPDGAWRIVHEHVSVVRTPG